MVPQQRNRRSIRLRGYDYSQVGAYFITIDTHDRECLFGKVEAGKVILSAGGRTADVCWRAIPDHFPAVQLDAWVVMPNHVHGILIVTSDMGRKPHKGTKPPVGANDNSPLRFRPAGTSRTLGSIVRGYKIGVTKWYRAQSINSRIWQRNYWERIIRKEVEMDRIRWYIKDNPNRWAGGRGE